MNFYMKESIFVLLIVCLLLVLSSNLTYSKFTYSKEVSGSLVTYKPSFVDSLIASATLDTDVDFDSASSSTNGQGLMMREGTQNDEYPIVYYRGDVSNNNVIFADLCWLIVRTTETGGIKLLYNGEINDDGSCTNFSGVGGQTYNTTYANAYIESSSFNASIISPVYVGYMYNDTKTYFTGSGNSGTLDAAGYIAHLSDNSIDSETGRHLQNKYDSTIKGVVDDWYEANILGKPEESLLEDTVWCNDRSLISEEYPIENYATNNYIFSFASYTRLGETMTATPSLVCSRDIDKFTVDSANGNGDLDYPIGLLTADEMNLAGHPCWYFATTYLKIPSHYYWSMSPYRFVSGHAAVYILDYGSLINGYTPEYTYVYKLSGVRPSVSLKSGISISEGTGSFESPYLIN